MNNLIKWVVWPSRFYPLIPAEHAQLIQILSIFITFIIFIFFSLSFHFRTARLACSLLFTFHFVKQTFSSLFSDAPCFPPSNSLTPSENSNISSHLTNSNIEIRFVQITSFYLLYCKLSECFKMCRSRRLLPPTWMSCWMMFSSSISS